MKFLYVTFANKEEAVSIAGKLLEENLIACANILDGSTSIYRWKGKTEQQQEAIAFLKTTDEKVQQSMDRIKELHSYDVPCVLVLPVESGVSEFIGWVEDEVAGG